jgi:Na+/H+ antiporter NhaD/arsenite permease-like protein
LPSLDAHWPIAAVFAVVYVGMFLGGLPTLKLDRSGIALLGAIAVIPLIGSSVEDAARAVDLPTLVLLFAFMVLSAQMRLGGFYTEVRSGWAPCRCRARPAGGADRWWPRCCRRCSPTT